MTTKTFTSVLAEATKHYTAGENSEAVAKYSQAIKLAPPELRWSTHLSRARALFRMRKYSRAISDCSEVLGANEPDLACSANQLKGECFLQEEEFDVALEAFQAAKETAKGEQATKAIDAFIAQTEKELAAPGSIDMVALKRFSASATAKERGFVPAPKKANELADKLLAMHPNSQGASSSATNASPAGPSAPSPDPKAAMARVQEAMSRAGPSVRAEDLSLSENPFAGNIPLVAPSKYRMQFNQNSGGVEVQVFAKKLNTQKERVTVTIESNKLTVEIKDEACAEVEYTLSEELYQEVDVEASKWTIMSTQINVKLKKVDGSISWPSLSKSDIPAVPGGANIVDPNAGPATGYPTSHKKAVHDWNKIESDVKQEEKDEKLDGDAGLQKFFKGLYAGLDDDARRAMNKSFQESGGTTLSTNWKDISKEELTCVPPEGVKVKKFEQ